MHCGVEVTESSTNKQHHLSDNVMLAAMPKERKEYDNRAFRGQSYRECIHARVGLDPQLSALI